MLKKLFAKLTGGSEEEKFEASMNFDMENVDEFAKSLNEKFGPGLRADVLSDFVRSVPVEEERTLVLQVGTSEAPETLEMIVHMDDVDAPDIYFYSPSSQLIDEISDEMVRFAESMGI